MINEERDNISLFKIFRRLVPMAFKACPLYLFAFGLSGTIMGALATLNTMATNGLFDAIPKYVSNKITFSAVLIQLLLLCSCIVLFQVFNGIVNYIGNNVFRKVSGKIGKIINLKSARMNPIDFENPLFLDDINKAQKGLESGMDTLGIFIMLTFFYIPYFIFMGIYLYSLKPVLTLSILIIFIPVALSQLLKVKLFTNLEDKVAPIRREYQYYEKCMMDREYFKETRLLGCFGYFKKLYADALDMFNFHTFKTQKKSAVIEFSLKLLTLCGYLGVLMLLVSCVLDKSISVGAFGAVLGSLGMMVEIMREILCMHIGRLVEELGTVKNLTRFMDMEERGGKDIEITDVPEINMDNVSFTYPGTSKSSISNVSLHINKGETVAIVGENGAGKSTLVRLLTGIYLPTSGTVEFNGYNTQEVSPKSLFSNISGVFQKFQKYKMTLNENISISDTVKPEDSSRINNSTVKADLEVAADKFPDGYNTMLSREFDGVDLSGGQWQRVAIARGFYKDHNMIVLDEPTAAIDPIEETKLYKKFKEMSEGKTAVIVTHRLGSAKIADKIVVLDKGQVVQVGTHDELIAKEGKYKEMYEAQSKWYEDDSQSSMINNQ